MTPSPLHHTASQAIGLLDLTNLNDDCDEAAIDALVARAFTPHGSVAALCIWPRFIKAARAALAGRAMRLATVVNFPAGTDSVPDVVALTEQALTDGADEIDLVFPYEAYLAGRKGYAESMIVRVRETIGARGKLKVILETGVLEEAAIIRAASDLAIGAGADFIKTSTGKAKINATPEAAEIMLTAIADCGRPVGFKPAGGIRTSDDAALYLGLAARILGEDWATAETFRFGASGVLDALLATLDGTEPTMTEGY